MLVVSPHADDETLGCGGLLALKRQRGEDVTVVYLTDSAGSPEAGGSADRSARRQSEAWAALAVLGVPRDRAFFLQAPDGCLNRLPPDQRARVVGTLATRLSEIRPTEVFVPFLGGGSTEHDAAVEITREALRAAGLAADVWEYPVWAWWDPRRLAGQLGRPHENFHVVLGSARATKQAALACHVSQVEPAIAGGSPDLPRVLARLATGPVEFFFLRK